MDACEMRAFQFREAHGYLPDDVYNPTAEDLTDPDHNEIAALVVQRYAVENAERRESRMRAEIDTLRQLLAENGVEVPDGV